MVAVAALLAACTSSQVTTSAGAPTSVPASRPTATSAAVPATAVPPPTTGPAPPAGTPAPTTAPGGGCPASAQASTIAGEFDGDGIADTAYFDSVTLHLVVCRGAGGAARVEASGMGEVLAAVDFHDDGRDEILTGGTTAWGRGADVVVLTTEGLEYVTFADGTRLSLWEGLSPDGFLAYGCPEVPLVAVVEGSTSEGVVTWRRTVVAVDGARAEVVASDEGAFTATGAPDPLSEPGLARVTGGACGR